MATKLKACVVLDPGWAMLAPGGGPSTAAEVVSIDEITGYFKDLMLQLLQPLPAGYSEAGGSAAYTVKAYDSYGEMTVRTRAGQCDIGFGNYYLVSTRQECLPGQFNPTCQPLGNVTAAGSPKPISWEPYRCCVDYSLGLWPADVVVLHPLQDEQDFFAAFFAMISR